MFFFVFYHPNSLIGWFPNFASDSQHTVTAETYEFDYLRLNMQTLQLG